MLEQDLVGDQSAQIVSFSFQADQAGEREGVHEAVEEPHTKRSVLLGFYDMVLLGDLDEMGGHDREVEELLKDEVLVIF